MSKLLPCPFCGGEAKLWQPPCSKFKVSCLQCDASTGTEGASATAMSLWNTRAQDWIDIDSDQPQEGFEVIACCKNDVEMCIYSRSRYDGRNYFEKISNGDIFNATKWMPKPAPYHD